MDVATGELPCVVPNLSELGNVYNLAPSVEEDIGFVQAGLKSIQAALCQISNTPAHLVSQQTKNWARNAREMLCDIEDRIDTFMMRDNSSEPTSSSHFKELIDRTLGLFMPTKICRDIATEIRDIKSRVKKLCLRRDSYEVEDSVALPVTTATLDARLLALYKEETQLVGINEPRDEVIRRLVEGNNELPRQQQDKIVSIVGFRGLGKTTLANAVYKKLGTCFDCCAFLSVHPRTPDIRGLLKNMLCQLRNNINEETLDDIQVINLHIKEFLGDKRFFIVIDDIWDISVWERIRCALPPNNSEYRIVTTTCNFNIAENIGGAYRLKPLSLDNSRILFYRTIFGDDYKEKCLHEPLAEVSDKILKKCAGVPLAIIPIASLLAKKEHDEREWYNVYNSIGSGQNNNLGLEDMRTVLSLSYYDLPAHIKTCFLYLSMFPRDHEICKDRLIWMWIAEGFVPCGAQGKSMFEVGESYFNELINRSIIYPAYGWSSSMIRYCRVHNMVLDLIRSLSNEEHYATVLDGMPHTSPSERVSRLSLQNTNEYYAAHKAAMKNMSHVRSVVVFPSSVSMVPLLWSFKNVRVLDIENSYISKGYSLDSLGSLRLLRYLRVRDRGIYKLPEEIKNLQFLQTLDVMGTGISSLPSTVIQLKYLICLRIDSWTRVPSGIGSLTSLQEMSTLSVDNFTDIEDLGSLTELRVLGIDCLNGWDLNSSEKSLVECLNRLKKVESLYISVSGECNLDGWDTPLRLRRLELPGCWSSSLSIWMKQPLLLQDLTSVSIEFGNLCQDDVDLLGMLPALSFLDLEVDHEDLKIFGRVVIGACSFPSLVHCMLRGSIGPVEFQKGAMPRLTALFLTFPVHEMRETADCYDGFNLGLGNLQSLREVTISFLHGSASEGDGAEKAEAALRHAIETHPNHPTLEIR